MNADDRPFTTDASDGAFELTLDASAPEGRVLDALASLLRSVVHRRRETSRHDGYKSEKTVINSNPESSTQKETQP